MALLTAEATVVVAAAVCGGRHVARGTWRKGRKGRIGRGTCSTGSGQKGCKEVPYQNDPGVTHIVGPLHDPRPLRFTLSIPATSSCSWFRGSPLLLQC